MERVVPMNQQDLWVDFEREVKQTNSLTISVFPVSTRLATHIKAQSSAIQYLHQYSSLIMNAHHRGMGGMRYVYRVESSLNIPFDDWSEVAEELAEQQNCDQVSSATICFWIVARDADLARKRFESFALWLEGVNAACQDFAHLDWRMLKAITLQSAEEITLEPITQVVNYPNAKYWKLSNIDSAFTEDSVEEYQRFRMSESLTIRTDSVHEAVAALETTMLLLPTVLDDSYQWKWVMFSVHNAIQGFMVSSLQNTNPSRVLKDSVDSCHPSRATRPQLKNFLELYSDIKSDQSMLQYTNSATFKPKGSQGGNINELNRLRNEFTHFTPKSWVIGPERLFTFPQVIDDVLDVIEFLSISSNNIPWYHDDSLRRRTRTALESSRIELERISLEYVAAAKSLGDPQHANRFKLARLKSSKNAK